MPVTRRDIQKKCDDVISGRLLAVAVEPEVAAGGCREDRLTHFSQTVASLAVNEREVHDMLLSKEQTHLQLVNTAFPAIHTIHYGVPVPAARPLHDHTKDNLYIFLTGLKFDCGLSDQRLDSLVQVECDRHYLLEAHHPQHETLTGNECSDTDILEMAVDRLCRNVQVNEGLISDGEMEKYAPTFTLGDTNRKLAFYCACVKQYRDHVEHLYRELFQEKQVGAIG